MTGGDGGSLGPAQRTEAWVDLPDAVVLSSLWQSRGAGCDPLFGYVGGCTEAAAGCTDLTARTRDEGGKDENGLLVRAAQATQTAEQLSLTSAFSTS